MTVNLEKKFRRSTFAINFLYYLISSTHISFIYEENKVILICTPNETNVVDPDQTSLDKNKEVLVSEHPIHVLQLINSNKITLK